MLDVIVAGGGPVGLATSLYAARCGLDVVVFEPRAGAIDKACGEGLMPGAVSALADLGVDPAGRTLRGIRYVDDGRSAQADFRCGPGRGVRRTTLHAALLAAVVAAGIVVEQRAVGEVRQDDDGVDLEGVRTRYLVAADGLHSPIRRSLGLSRPLPTTVARLRRFGLRCHAEVTPWSDYVEVHWSPYAEAYVTPVGDRMLGVAVLTSRPGPYADLLRGFPQVVDRLGGAALSRVRGAGPLRQATARRVSGRVLLVGDASGYVDALTGEGIALGLAQARAAVAAILAGRPLDYERAWHRVTWRYRLLTSGLLGASRVGPLRRSLVPVGAALPWLFSAAVDQLARPA